MDGWLAACITAVGIVIVACTLADILITTLHPSIESPISARGLRTAWRVIGWVGRRLPAQVRRRALGWIMPWSIAGLLAAWLIGLLFGFALVYMPGMSSHTGFSSAFGRLTWIDAIYFSGTCLTTIGFGDISPAVTALRFTAVGEGICGLLVVAVSVTYVLSVYPVLPQARVLARTLNEESDGQVDAVPLVARYLAVGSTEALAARCREIATTIIVLSDAHTAHPVLFYAHPRRVEQSFLRALVVTQRLVALLRYGLPAEDYPGLVRDPRVVGLEESLISALRQMGRSLHLRVPEPSGGPDQVRRLEQQHAHLLDRLQGAGLRRTRTAGTKERGRYIRFRLVTDPFIDAYSANSGYTAEELWGDHPPLRGTTAPLPGYDDELVAEEQ